MLDMPECNRCTATVIELRRGGVLSIFVEVYVLSVTAR